MSLDFLEIPIQLSGLDQTTYQYFDNLLNHRTILFNEEVSETIVESVIMPLRKFEADDNEEPVCLIINTPGGSLNDGLILCNLIDQYKKKLDIIVLGYAYSMGTIAICAGNFNPNVTKYCYPFSYALIHDLSAGVGGDMGTMKDMMAFYESMASRIKDYILTNTRITKEEYEAAERKQWFLTASEMKEKGLIDIIIT